MNLTVSGKIEAREEVVKHMRREGKAQIRIGLPLAVHVYRVQGMS